MSLHPDWIDFPLDIDINDALMCSVNGGDWHGKAIYTVDAVDGFKKTKRGTCTDKVTL